MNDCRANWADDFVTDAALWAACQIQLLGATGLTTAVMVGVWIGCYGTSSIRELYSILYFFLLLQEEMVHSLERNTAASDQIFCCSCAYIR